MDIAPIYFVHVVNHMIKEGRKIIFPLLLLVLLVPNFSFADVPISEPPKIIFYPKRTARPKAIIRGQTCSKCDVFIEVENNTFSGVADESGIFEIEVSLEENKDNKVNIYSQKAKKKSPPTQILITHYSIGPPDPNSPPKVDLDSIPKYTNDPGIRLFGRTKPNSKVVALGGSAKAEGFSDSEGFFELLIFLKFDQMNEIDVYYEDEQGFISPKTTFQIYQISKAPPAPKLEKVPEYTNHEKIKIKGRTVPGFGVVAELPTGSRVEYRADDQQGNFDVEVSLIPNSENKISLYTVDFAGNFSAAERIVIFQDSIPPRPPEIILYPSQVYQDSATVLGKGEPGAKIVSRISEREYELGMVDKAGNFITTVPVPKFKRQTRRNYINMHLVDGAGNISEPTLIVIDALPDINQTNIGINFGIHSFTGLISKEFFDGIRKSPLDFTGLSVELRYTRIFQRRSGPAFTLVSGFTTSFGEKVDIPQLGDPSVNLIGTADELSQITLSTMYIIANIGLAFFFEDFDLIPSVGFGGLGFIKAGPVLEGNTILKEDRLFFSYVVRTEISFRYSITEDLNLQLISAYSVSPIRNVNESGHSVDGGGFILGLGINFGF